MKPCSTLLTLAVSLSLAAVSKGADAPARNDPWTQRMLVKRRAAQLEAVKQCKAFHDFQFTNRLKESGITFEHFVVDDAAKNWKPAHYDHGNGIAVADVDGDEVSS